MNADKKPTARPCKKLPELPPVIADGQQAAWCPDCDYYDGGMCSKPVRRDGSVACPFDGKVLPLREVAVEAANEVAESPPRPTTLEQAIKDRIVTRTGRRMQALTVERTNRQLVVRGTAPCYYVKQLALQGVLDVLHSDQGARVGFSFQVVVYRPGPT
jgi:hypothetical protein